MCKMPSVVLMIALLVAGRIGTNAEKLDIAIFVDGSSTVCGAQSSCPNWGYIIQFICDIVDGLTIGPDNTRVSVITFSTLVWVQWDFNKYTDKNSLLSAIRNLAYPGDKLVLIPQTFVVSTVFSLVAGDRPDARSVALVITDGIPFTYATLASAAVDVLYLLNVEVLMVCVTPGCTESFAKSFSSPPRLADQTYFLVSGFGLLSTAKANLLAHLLAS